LSILGTIFSVVILGISVIIFALFVVALIKAVITSRSGCIHQHSESLKLFLGSKIGGQMGRDKNGQK
jgi:hypothetical protein